MTKMSSDTRKETSIFDRASICEHLFKKYLSDPLENAEDTPKLIYQYERFNHWAGHLGVMASDRLSLDDRLHGIQDIRDWVLELLEVLEVNLNDHIQASSKSVANQFLNDKSASTEGPSLAHAAFEGVQESLNRLHWLGNVIRKSSTSQLASRVSRFVNKQGDEEMFAEQMSLLLVRGLYPNITDAFAQQLARSISFRRQRLLYQKDREKVIKKQRRNSRSQPQETRITREVALEEEKVPPLTLRHTEEASYKPATPDPIIPLTEKASTLNPVQLWLTLEKQVPVALPDDLKSATSITHNGPYPKTPEWSSNRERLCQCDWCFQEIPYTQREEQWSSAWKSHFEEDLEPYVCISEDCSERLRYFVSRREWREHMDDFHSADWTQEIHKQDIWYCASDQHRFQQFPTPTHLRGHMMNEHKDTPIEELETTIKRNVLPKPRGATECPLCGQDGTIDTGAAMPAIKKSSTSVESAGQQRAKTRKLVQFQTPPGYNNPDRDEYNESTHSGLPMGREPQLDDRVKHLKLTRHIALHLKSLSFASLRYFDDEDVFSGKSRDTALGERNSQKGSNDHHGHYFELEDVSLTFEDLGSREHDDLSMREFKQGSDLSSAGQPVDMQKLLKKLADDVDDAMLDNCLETGRFLPCDQLESLLSPEMVTSVINGGNDGEFFFDRNALIEFVLQDARKLFLILVLITRETQKISSWLNDFYSHDVFDDLLPIEFEIEEDGTHYGVAAYAGVTKSFHFFKRWERNDCRLFDNLQNSFLAPVFSADPLHHQLHPKTILPFLEFHTVYKPASGLFCQVSRVEIHKAHVPQSTPNSVTDMVSVVIKKAQHDEELAEFFDRAAGNLRTLCEYKSPHLTRPIAAYHLAQDRCLVFPWADGGTLGDYWTGFEDQRLDPSGLRWIVLQLGGILSAVNELHESNSHHGNLNPENILWFRDEIDRGTLQIASFSLATFHAKEKKTQTVKGVRTLELSETSRYGPPEMRSIREINDAPSRQDDMWSMGCVALELLVWIVYGNKALDIFKSFTEHFWEPGDKAGNAPCRVHSYVVSCIRVMKFQLLENGRDETAYQDMLRLVEERLLVIPVSETYVSSTDPREIAAVLLKQMAEIEENCQSSEIYLEPIDLEYPFEIIRAQQEIGFNRDHMRLLYQKEDGSLGLTQTLVGQRKPPYAILSHTWLLENDEEVTYEDILLGKVSSKPNGYAKLRFCNEQAAKHGLKYFWVDTCCIDRSSSVELQAAITAMFSFYSNAARCFVYLADVSINVAPSQSAGDDIDTSTWKESFSNCRWFTRGWTLLELLAPKFVEFFSADSVRLGDRQSLQPMIHEITGIPRKALEGRPMAHFSVDERLSWASNRETRYGEDKAYCLLGIFDVVMTLDYGEGAYALDRLRQEIDKKNERNIELLSLIPLIPEAAFNSFHNRHETTCLPSTRAELLRDIEQWVNSKDEKCIFWLNGLAGTGKSTIARTIARNHHELGNLAASFFFSGGGKNQMSADKFVTTIARQLANTVPPVRYHICKAIEEQEDIANHSLRDQWERLIAGPLRQLGHDFSSSPLLIVVDALDECSQERDIEIIIRVLNMSRSLANIRLRILITSRPEILIRHSFHKIPEPERGVFVLHEISPELVDRDIGIYFEEQFSALREERGFEHDWPGTQIVKRLVEASSGLFIWASTASRFIREGRRLAMIRIQTLINGSHSNAGPEKQLDQIYTQILRHCIPRDADEEEKKELCENLRAVLGSIAMLYSPLPLKSLAGLLDVPFSDIQETLADLHPILNIPSQESHPIRLHHPTFRDFLLDAKRCGDADFSVSAKQAHAALADHCLRMMSEFLKRDICGLGSPGVLQEDVDPRLIALSIPPELQYACLYWVEHYRQSGRRFSDDGQVDRFFKKHFLHWLEAINMIGKSGEMGAIVRLYHALLQPSVNANQISFVKDARRFMLTFQDIFRKAPLQIYCAGLAFAPTTNELKSHFNYQMHTWIHDVQIAEAAIPKAKDEFNYVSDLAFTPDCRQIASGSNFGAVRSWDIATKTKVHKFDGTDDKISSVAISPDGTILAAGSDDFTVIVWDLNTKEKLHTLNDAHLGWVNSVAFSPDGKTLASGSMDETVALWEVATGRELRRLNNQSSCVNSVIFSPDGSLIATGSVDKMVRLWNISKNSTNLQLMLKGHSGCVNSVKFSPHGAQIISGSDDMTIKLWDSARGFDYRTLKGHEKKVMTVAFSSNSQLIASGSEDKTIRLWDAARGTQLRILGDHLSGINTVLFSPDGNLLASSSFDDEIRLWDAKTWEVLGKLDDFEEDIESGTLATQQPYSIGTTELSDNYRQQDGHSSKVNRLVFSSDGLWLASGSEDGTIKLWQGAVEHFKLEGHSGRINDLMFSSDSCLLASASGDGALRLWSPSTGTASLTLRSHSGEVLRVLFSANGQLVASCYADSTVIVWHSSNGRAIKTIEGQSVAVTDIAFSPDNRSLASCSVDATLTIWDIVDGTAPVAIRGHDRAINSVRFSQDSKLLVSCSEDGTIRLWSRNGASCGMIRTDTPSMTCVTFLLDSRIVASLSTGGKISLWDTGSMSLIRSLDVGTAIRKIAYSKCGRYLETDRGSLLVDPPSGSLQPIHSPTSSTHLHYLFVTENWIMRHGLNLLWLPEEFFATDVAVMGNHVVLGHASGSVSFISVPPSSGDIMAG